MMRIIECEQGTPEWRAARCGLPTASMFSAILAKGEGKTRRSYLLRLAGEMLTGEAAETYENQNMVRGRDMEDEARRYYSITRDAKPQRVGFIVNGRKGCSPDSLLDDAGMLEIKTALPHILIALLLKDDFPPEHKAQCQGALWVAEREWIDIAVYWPGIPMLVKRAARDDNYIARLAEAVEEFNVELAQTVQKVRALGGERGAVEFLAAG